MKRFLKIVSLLSLVCLLLPTLCGCFVVDELRESRASYNENGDIVWNGAVYKELPLSDHFCPETNAHEVYVAAEDVPVLLLSAYGAQALTADEEKLFLEHSYYIYGGEPYSTILETYYCREDRYEEFAKRIENGFKGEILCYDYYGMNPETGEYEDKRYILTQEQKDTLDRIVQTAEGTTVEEGWYLAEDYTVYLEARSKDMLFKQDSMDISVSGSTYYIKYGLQVYQVPAEDIPVMKQIMAEYINNY